MHGCPGEWDLIECRQCGVISLSPWPGSAEEIGSFYPNNYEPYQTTKSLLTNRLAAALRRLMIAPYSLRYGNPGLERPPHGGGRFLDVGCGNGLLLKRMSDCGWDTTGIDMSSLAIQAAHANAPRASLHVGTLEDTDLEGPFDLIAMYHVLEHVPHPVECLAKCFELLAPSGVLSVCVPNVGSFEAKVFGRGWSGLDVPRHLVLFRQRVLIDILKKCGFEIETVRPQLFPASVSESMLLQLPSRLRKKILHTTSAHALYLLSIFPAALSYLLGNFGIMEVRARKPSYA